MNIEDKNKLLKFLESLVTVQGYVSIDRGTAHFEDGTQTDIGQLLDILILES